MKLLKENYEGLEKVNTIPEQLKTFLSNPNNQELFKNNDFKTLYSRLSYNCSGLTELLISLDIDPLKYLDHIPGHFLANTTIESINIPNNIKRIDSEAFSGCFNLTNVTIPNSVKSIGWNAFWMCKNLTYITIPDSVTSIGDDVFGACTGLTHITLPKTLTGISRYAFNYCSGLTDIHYMGTKDQWSKIKLERGWDNDLPIKTIHCVDGDITL